jgi:hypothetical protein
VRITARLIDTSTDRNEWAACYEGEILIVWFFRRKLPGLSPAMLPFTWSERWPKERPLPGRPAPPSTGPLLKVFTFHLTFRDPTGGCWLRGLLSHELRQPNNRANDSPRPGGKMG